jgi:predicted transcriptional regulator
MPKLQHPKKPNSKDGFSRREREIMDALYASGKATAQQIHEALPNPPGYTAVRTLLTILEKKGHVRHSVDGQRYVYEPAMPREQMGRRAIGTLLSTFYGNSVEKVVAAMLENEDVAPDTLDRLAALIENARKEGR